MIRILFPVTAIAIAAILFCFYYQVKKRRTQGDATATMQVQAISIPDDQEETDTHFDLHPPRYSTVDQPPPYSQFDPKLGGSPPPYDMFPITLPLASHWMTPLERLEPSPPSSPLNQDHSRRASFS